VYQELEKEIHAGLVVNYEFIVNHPSGNRETLPTVKWLLSNVYWVTLIYMLTINLKSRADTSETKLINLVKNGTRLALLFPEPRLLLLHHFLHFVLADEPILMLDVVIGARLLIHINRLSLTFVHVFSQIIKFFLDSMDFLIVFGFLKLVQEGVHSQASKSMILFSQILEFRVD
jgi:hypothetical protein